MNPGGLGGGGARTFDQRLEDILRTPCGHRQTGDYNLQMGGGEGVFPALLDCLLLGGCWTAVGAQPQLYTWKLQTSLIDRKLGRHSAS